jgi:hypothetical protein
MWSTPLALSTCPRLLEHLAWGEVVQRLMRALVVVKREPGTYTPTCLGYRAVRLDEHLFVLQAAPQREAQKTMVQTHPATRRPYY